MDDLIDIFAYRIGADKSFADKFKICATNSDRVKLVKSKLKEYSISIVGKTASGIPSTNKHDGKSLEFRQSGHKWYSQDGRHFDALENYNESLCFAEENSENLGLSYASRAAVYYDWKLNQLCHENIQLAKKSGYPDRLKNELVTLQTKCKKKLKRSKKNLKNSPIFEPTLSFKPHDHVPFIADCLDIRRNKKYGRYIITNRNLSTGQILAIEDRYFSVLLPKLRYQRCANCLTENCLSLIPCRNCTGAMFCSQYCYDEANQSFHQFECPIIDFLHETCNRTQLIALRAAIYAITSYDSLDELKKDMSNIDNIEVTAFSCEYPTTSKKEQFLKILSFPTKQAERSTEDLFGVAAVASALYDQLMDRTNLKPLLPNEEDQNLLMELLFRFLQIARMYFHSLSLSNRQYRSPQGGVIGSAAFPFCSLINHSCSPNIVRIPFGNKMVVFVLRNIKKGEQLFDNYGSHHFIDTLSYRQEEMQLNYLFACDCNACTNNFPSHKNLPNGNIENGVTDMDTDKLMSGDAVYAAQRWKRFCEYLSKYDSKYPCTQLNIAQSHLREALHIMADNISISLKY
ncbi:SET and MYND domain-containing protein DDB_G0273589-like [Bradysia coprophila]|uniref:SET and MYND domain-containing protein DDB_G0273589-like n=1 Tax=Bradysia coprophila TaxID=38358 RepID=UPI00187DBDF5|nr:SET and MYND domain-containing protein DDB_G0273589-like [Bradysia coprophila]